jgi:SPP1 gp7 family putative phage head morphogenesis protein
VNKEYQSSVEQIKVDGENYATSEMKGVFLAQAAALAELHKIIGKVYIDYAKDGMLSLTTAEKAMITAKTTKTLKDMGLTLGKSEVDAVKGILANVFKDTYYKNIYTLESGMTVNLKFNILKEEFVDAAVNAKYKEELFSDRIWTNKADMVDALQKNITGAMKGDVTIDKIGRQIRDTFNVTAYDSQRLVNTEVARVQTQASEDMGRDTGVVEVMWSATLENNTCDECAELDGQTYPIDEAPDCPEHPECRCCLINVPYEGWSPTQRRDNETKDLIDYKNYADWAKDKEIQ